MTLDYLTVIARFCDDRFEFVPGAETFDLRLDCVRKSLALNGRVSGGTGAFCSFLYWQLRRNGFTPVLWYVRDINGYEFFVINLYDYYVSYYDGKIYISSECPWKPIKKSTNLKEWQEC